MKAIGATYAVITAKHGCGFLLWPTKVALPSGRPYTYHVPEQMNVLKEFVAALSAAGIGHGFYFSLTNNFYLNTLGHTTKPSSTLLPGQELVTQEQYENISIALMTELWTEFGALQEIWLDGGCGNLCDRVASLYRTSPNAASAVAFNGGGGVSANAVRWCGTESGSPPGWPTVWSTADCGWCPDGSGSGAPPNATNAAWSVLQLSNDAPARTAFAVAGVDSTGIGIPSAGVWWSTYGSVGMVLTVCCVLDVVR